MLLKRSFIIILIGACFFLQCKKSDNVSITVKQEGPNIKMATLYLGNDNATKEQLDFGDDGIARKNWTNFTEPIKGRLIMNSDSIIVVSFYLRPGDNLNILIGNNQVSINGGCESANNYLNRRKTHRYKAMTDLSLTEKIASIEADIEAATAELGSYKLPEDFEQAERVQIKYSNLRSINGYYSSNFRSKSSTAAAIDFPDAYYNKIASYMKDDGQLLKNVNFRAYMLDAIKALVTKNDYNDFNNLARAEGVCQLAVDMFHDSEILEYLISSVVIEHIEYNGVDDAENLINFFDKYVKTDAIKEKFYIIYNKWDVVRKGKQSLIFDFLDINGERVSLDDFKGKYVYIDCWASWCMPCCNEIPYIQALEEEFHGKKIAFVSISIDNDKKSWEKKVKKDQLKGVQLHVGNDITFTEAYMISSIPRFILIDTEGKIISANCTRPSDPKTRKLLEELPLL